MAFDEPVAPSELLITPTGHVVLRRDGEPLVPDRATVETSYERSKGPKVLNRLNLEPARLEINPSLALTRFDPLFAIDTNTRDIRNNRISVACFVRCAFSHQTRGVLAAFWPTQALEIRGVCGDPERVAWYALIDAMIRHPMYDTGWNIGVVVDSSLGGLDAYNTRAEPVLGTWYLPSNFTLVYASSDAASASLGNRMIAQCDTNARQILDLLAEDPNRGELTEVENEPYTRFRMWM